MEKKYSKVAILLAKHSRKQIFLYLQHRAAAIRFRVIRFVVHAQERYTLVGSGWGHAPTEKFEI